MKPKNKKENLRVPSAQHISNRNLESGNEENHFYENIVDTVREPLLILDKDLRVVKANQSFFDFFKVSPDETTGTLIYNLGNNQWDIPKLRELLETILPEKTIFNDFEVEHIFSTIGKRIMLLNARQIERAFGKEKIILLAIEDITDRKRSEDSFREKSRRTDEYLEILLDRAHAPIIIWESSFVIDRFNHEFEKLSGYEASEVIGKPIKILFPKDKADSFIDLLKNHLSDDNSEAFVIDILCKDKVIKTVLWSSVSILDKEDKYFVATIAQDITKQKQTTDKLASLETRYRRLFESAQDGILILDAETGKIIDVNPFLCDLLDYSKEKFIDKELWQIGFFKDIAANKEKFLELQQKEYVRYEDLPLETTGGRKINVEFVSNVYLVNNHKVIQCNIRDITKHKKLIRNLINSEARLRTLVQTIPDLIWLKDVNGVYLLCNPMFERFFGAKEVDIVGKTDYAFVDKELADFFRENDIKAMDAGKPTSNEELITFADDRHQAYLETIKMPINDFDGKRIGVLGIGRDITERKNYEKQLKESEEKFRTITESSPDAIFTHDKKGKLLYVNNKAVQMLGYSKEELLSFTIADVVPKERVEEQNQIFEQLLETGSKFVEVELVKRNGELIPVDINAVLLPDGLVYGSCRDITERKLMVNEVKQSETLLSEAMKIASLGTWEYDVASDQFEFNDQFYMLLRTTAEKEGGYIMSSSNYARKFVHPDDISVVGLETKKALQTTDPNYYSRIDHRIIYADGNLGYITVHIRIKKDQHGHTVKTFGVNQDITERKQNEELLLKLSRAVEQSPASIIITNTEGNIEYINPKVTELTGYTLQEVVGGKPNIFSSGEKSESEYKDLWKSISSGKEWRGEFHNKKKNGELYWESASISPIINEKGIITHYLAVKEDITDQKRTALEIISQKNKFAQLFDNSPVAIVLLDDNDRIINVNEAFTKLFGFPHDELIGILLNEIIVPDELKKEYLACSVATQSGKQFYQESYRQRKDGSKVYVKIIGIPILLNNKIVGIYGMYVDMTHQKDVQEKLKVAKELAEQSDKLKSEFLAQMSHEIRTPINIVLGYLEYLNELFGEKKNSEAEGCFNGINLASKRIIRTIDLLLNASELQTGNYQPYFVKIDLDEGILNKLYQEFQLAAKQRGLELIYNSEVSETELFVDEYSTTQIFVNLIDNALNYTKKGKVEILLTKNITGSITVEIKDTGIGIAKEFLPRLFDAFTQEEQGYTRSFEGNGLGLALVKSYCDINNASIEVESEKNVGSTFRVIFNNGSALREMN